MIKLILTIRFLSPLICSNKLFLFSKSAIVLCGYYYVVLFGYIKYYLIRIVFLEIYWPNYYFTIVIMEATRSFCWFLAIYLPAIGAHNQIVLILQALFLSAVSYYYWPFLHLFLTEGAHYLIQSIFNYFIAVHYMMILHRYFMFKYC